MKTSLLSLLVILCAMPSVFAQLVQTARYELEKKNTDDYFTVVPAGDRGLVVFRDTDDYKRGEGDVWEVVSLDTALVERWKKEMTIDDKYVFKGFEMYDATLFLLFSEGELPGVNYHLITIRAEDGEITRYDIKNEIALELSHLIVVDDYLVMGGYVRYSPTFVSYHLSDDKVQVIPGFFKDRSDIVDIKANQNGTFNTLTLEKDYEGYFLRLRTYSPKGDMLFEKAVQMSKNYRVLNGKTTDFVDGNIAITGSYGNAASYYSQGIYFAIVKPEGQKDIVRYYNFTDLEHFFDYTGPRRSERIRKKIDARISKGKDFRYNSRLFMHDVYKDNEGYILSAEIYDPQYEKLGGRELYSPYQYGFGNNNFNQYPSTAYQKYVKRPGRLSNVDDANHFKYLESIVVKLDKDGDLAWDNSMKIDDVETFSLEQVVDFDEAGDKINLLYKGEGQLHYKVIDESETLTAAEEDIRLKDENDLIKHTYEGVGGARYWYGDYFFVWGYHRIDNKIDPDTEGKRSVLFINKVTFEN